MPPGFLEWLRAQGVPNAEYFSYFDSATQQQLLSAFQRTGGATAPSAEVSRPTDLSSIRELPGNTTAMAPDVSVSPLTGDTKVRSIRDPAIDEAVTWLSPDVSRGPTNLSNLSAAVRPADDMSTLLDAIYAGFGPGGQNTLSRDQFEAQQAQFAQQLAFSQQQQQNQVAQLAQQNALNVATLAEATTARQQRDAQVLAQMGQSAQQFERSFALQQQQMGLTSQQIAAQIEDIRSRNAIAQQQLGLDSQRIAAQIELGRAQIELGRGTLAEQQRASQVRELQNEAAFLEGKRQFGLTFAEQQRASRIDEELRRSAQELSAGALMGTYRGQPTLARQGQEFQQGVQWSNIAGNPRNLGQSLAMLGYSQPQATGIVGGSPFYQQAISGMPLRFAPGDENFASPLATMGFTAPGWTPQRAAMPQERAPSATPLATLPVQSDPDLVRKIKWQ